MENVTALVCSSDYPSNTSIGPLLYTDYHKV